MAQRTYISGYYKGKIHKMTEEQSDFCRKAYLGGFCDMFNRGKFKRVISVDINSSYPSQMAKTGLPVGKARHINLHTMYKGQHILEGIY
jgi:hypothetical protein